MVDLKWADEIIDPEKLDFWFLMNVCWKFTYDLKPKSGRYWMSGPDFWRKQTKYTFKSHHKGTLNAHARWRVFSISFWFPLKIIHVSRFLKQHFDLVHTTSNCFSNINRKYKQATTTTTQKKVAKSIGIFELNHWHIDSVVSIVSVYLSIYSSLINPVRSSPIRCHDEQHNETDKKHTKRRLS